MTSWPTFTERGPEVTEGDVGGFEHRFGVALPRDYRAFLLEVNGGRTARTHRRFDRGILNQLFSLNDPDESHDLAAWNEDVHRDLKTTDLVIVGVDDGGGEILLVVNGDHAGEVWFQVHEGRPWEANPRVLWHDRRDVRKLADSFSAFMSSLRPLT
ncbi:MAG TPA: SMI1/KNR4 family protein [Kofleriaceae bacterium]|nr:SMI1/KNR4 family protein [Kofleriaceae bacterium]